MVRVYVKDRDFINDEATAIKRRTGQRTDAADVVERALTAYRGEPVSDQAPVRKSEQEYVDWVLKVVRGSKSNKSLDIVKRRGVLKLAETVGDWKSLTREEAIGFRIWVYCVRLNGQS